MKTKEELRQLHGKDYVENFKKFSPARLQRLIASIRLPDLADVVDIGCGNAMLMPLVAGRVKSYTGLDFSPEFIEEARIRQRQTGISNAKFECVDVREFCMQNKDRYDVAFAMDISEHVYDEEWLAILRAVRFSLKAKGRLILHTPNADFFVEIMKARGFILKQSPAHIAVRSREENERLIREAGFENIVSSYVSHYNILRFLHPFRATPLLGHYFRARLLIEASA